LRDFTDITIILDRSGSMGSIRDATIKGINDFITETRNVPGDGVFSLVQFDDKYENVYTNISQKEVPLLNRDTFVPRGDTALIDAVCRTIDETGQRLAAMPEEQRPNKVLLVIMTDGFENASQKYTRRDMCDRITHQKEKYNWKIVYLGANQDAIAEGGKYGIGTQQAMTYTATAAGVRTATASLNSSAARWKLGHMNDFVLDK